MCRRTRIAHDPNREQLASPSASARAPGGAPIREAVVGKTVLLDRTREDAEASGLQTIRVEAPEQRSLPALLAPELVSRVEFEPEALDQIVTETHGYPYFLQEWGKHAWDEASGSPVTSTDVSHSSRSAIAALDASFFRVRFDRLTPLEKRYLRAMAALGPGPHRSGDIADELHRSVTSLGPTRSQLIAKGMVWSPSHGDTAFTVPLFDEYMKRIMPGEDWRTV